MCMENQTAIFLILSMDVNLAVVDQIFDTVILAVSNSVEDWGLAFGVKIVWVTAFLDQIFHDLFVAFACSIKDGGLTVAVGVIGFATVLEEKLHELKMAISANIK